MHQPQNLPTVPVGVEVLREPGHRVACGGEERYFDYGPVVPDGAPEPGRLDDATVRALAEFQGPSTRRLGKGAVTFHETRT
jgi:hypothetical protein